MSEDQNTRKDLPAGPNRDILLGKFKNKFWAKEEKKIFDALLFDAFGSTKEPSDYMENIFSTTERVIGKNMVFRFLSEGRIGQAIDYMKNIDGLEMRKMDENFRTRWKIKPTNNISVRGNVMHVNTDFQNERSKSGVIKELAHEYAAWLADSGRLKDQGIPQRFDPNKKANSKDALTFLMYISAVDTIVGSRTGNINGEIPTNIVDFWSSV